MITKKTVIVVGAGASHDVGLPLGVDLQKRVADRLGDLETEESSYFRSAITYLFENDRSRADTAIGDARFKASRLRIAASVDNFLDQEKANVDFVAVAKMAITLEIAIAEQKSQMQGNISDEVLLKKCSDYFLLDLLNILVRGHQVENIKPSIENLTFIIFNYDRCVERFFYSWLRLRYGEAADDLIVKENFIHVYGSLGDYFDKTLHNPFEYSGRMAFQNPHMELPTYVDKLKVFTEQEDSETSQKISNAFHTAEAVIFLGFGFEEQNMRFFPKQANGKHVFATMLGASEANKKYLENMMRERFSLNGEVGVVRGVSKQLFKEYYHPITAAVGSLPN